jgi:hypothetical protein
MAIAMPEVQVAAQNDNAWKTYAGGSAGFHAGVGSMMVGHTNAESKGSSGCIFRNVQLPQGATIVSATVSVYHTFDQSTSVVRSRIRAYDAADVGSLDFSTEAEWDSIFPSQVTSTQVTWDNIPIWGGSPTWKTLPDISSVIQVIVNKPGWSSGNDIIIFWDDYEGRSDSGARRQFTPYGPVTNYGAKLNCSYSLGSGQVIIFE